MPATSTARSLRDSIARDRLAGRGREVGDGELVGGVDEVDAVVLHRHAVVHRRLGGADVHAPVDLHGIDGDEFDFRMRPGQRHRHVALARRGRPEDDERVRPSPGEDGDAPLVQRLGDEVDELPEEVMRRAVDDLDGRVRAGTQRRSAE